MRQVVTNLLSNAIKFTSTGEIRLTLRTCAAATIEPGSTSRWPTPVSASTRVGSRRCSSRSCRPDDSITRRFGGSGLGLAIVSQLVEMMGGEVGAESVLGEGSRFWFTVALERAQVPIGSDDLHTTLAGTRLLAVDDNETNRSLIVQLGRRWEMDVTAVSCAREALEQLRQAAARREPFHCVALDLHMPETNGIELAHAIFRDTTFPTPALVMLTSTADDRWEARAAGIDVYMTKPVRRTRLFNALAEAIGIKARREQVPVEAEDDVHAAPSPVILVAEDNEVNQILAIRMLQRRGYRAEAVGDGRHALEALQRGRYAAVLMDCQMPEQDGYDATSELRLSERGSRRTPVIAMTAHALGGDREKCLASGMDDYLAKPLEPKELDRVLRRWAPRIMEGSDGESRKVSATVDTPTDEGPLDLAGIERLGAELGSIAALRRPVELFATQTPELLTDMRQAIEAGDAEIVRSDAHKLKGGCMMLAATHMAELCRELSCGSAPTRSPGDSARGPDRGRFRAGTRGTARRSRQWSVMRQTSPRAPPEPATLRSGRGLHPYRWLLARRDASRRARHSPSGSAWL